MLEDLAYRYTQQSEASFMLMAFVVIALGALLSASLLAPRDGLLSRSYFYQRLGMASVLLMFNQVWWLQYVPLVQAGVSWLPALTDQLGYLAYGAYVIRIAQARSRDAYGTASRAWYILIPLVNLVLVFRASQTPGQTPGSVAAGVIGLVFVAISRLGTTALMTAVEEKTAQDMTNPAARAAFRTLMVAAEGPAPGLDAIIAAEGAPLRVGPDLSLVSVMRQDLHVTYSFKLDMTDANSLDDGYRREVTSGICTAYLPFMSQGASVTLNYTRPDGATVETLDLSLASCTT